MRPTKTARSEAAAAVSDRALAHFTGYRIKRAMTAIQADLARTLAPFELRMITYSALALIVDNPGISQSQLADTLSIERPNLVVIVDELETRDLIRRDKVPHDRRAYALNPTIRGSRLHAQATKAIVKHENAFLVRLDTTQRDSLIDALLAIEGTLKGSAP